MERETARGFAHLHRDETEKRALLYRLARIEGQVRGLRQMIEDDRYTGEVIQQTSAIKAALREVSILCLQDRAKAGIAESIEDHDGAVLNATVQELAALLQTAAAHGLAAVDHAATGSPPAPAQAPIEGLLTQVRTSVLLVEDDPVAAEVLKTGLDSLGCSVTVASTGEDALNRLQREDCTVDWLLADIVLPGEVDGWTVGEEFRQRNPYGRAVFISAYDQKDLSRKPQGTAFVYKPVRPAQLIEVFRGLEAA